MYMCFKDTPATSSLRSLRDGGKSLLTIQIKTSLFLKNTAVFYALYKETFRCDVGADNDSQSSQFVLQALLHVGSVMQCPIFIIDQWMKKKHEDFPSDSDQTECERHGSQHCSGNSCNTNKIFYSVLMAFYCLTEPSLDLNVYNLYLAL